MHRTLASLPKFLWASFFIPGILQAQPSKTALPAAQLPATVTATTVASYFNGFDEFVESVMNEWHVPGLAVAAIKDGEVVFSKGYGYRDVARELPMTPRTLLAIGSNSKSFTAMILGMLAEEGKLDWNEPVRTYLPGFQLFDEGAANQMTPRDLVTHRSGLPRHDVLWYGRSYSRKELFDRLRYIQPTTTFRGRWQYQNLMFMTAGYLAERITGRSWEDLVRERIFQPLGMARSNLSVTDSPTSDDFALPYMLIEDELSAIPFRNLDAVGPAGSINSTVEEMIRYVQMHINQGEYNGTRIISDETAALMQRPHSTVPGEPQHPEVGYASYGLGLMVTTYHGRKLVQHGGGIDGFISSMSWMPREKLGVVVLTNFSGFNPVPTIVQRNVYDRLLEVEPVDWVGRTREDQEEFEKKQAEQREKREANRKNGTSMSHVALSDYMGRYAHPGYGVIEIATSGEKLTIAMDRFRGVLEHYHYDVFKIEAADPRQPIDDMLITFLYNKEGNIDRVALPLEPTVDDIVFNKNQEEAQ